MKRNARTFFLASIFLSRVNYIKCSNLYNFCRYVDDLVDKKINNYIIKLNIIEKQLRRKDKITDSNVSSINFLIEKKMINFRNLLELIKGIRFDNRMNYLKKKKELINYSYLVAGTVGVMLCDLFSINNKQAYKFAVDLGIAMQLTNIARDVLEDAKLQRVYIPSEWVKLNINEILHPNFNSKKKIMIGTKKVLAIAEKYYKSAMTGLGYLPPRTRFAILFSLLVYREIGIKILRRNFSNMVKREKLSSLEKFKCFFKCVVIFIFNSNVHKKNIKHKDFLHKDLDNSHAF